MATHDILPALREAGLAPSSPLPGDLVRALAWLRDHPTEAASRDTLAAIAGVRPRTLEAHFTAFLGASPGVVARRLRLARARASLLQGRDGSVTAVALAFGFAQPGRFAGAYRRQYGELPSATLRRARGQRRDAIDDEALRLSSRALAAAFAVAPGPCHAALADAERAQMLAPRFGLPKAIAAWCLRQRMAQRFAPVDARDDERSLRLAREACTLAGDNALVLTVAAGALTLAHRLGEAEPLVERALALDPTSPWAWLRRGWISAYAGDAQAAARELATTLQLMPFEPLRHLALIGMGAAHFVAGRYDRAAAWAHDGVEASPDSFWGTRIAIAAAQHAGARAQARRMLRGLLRRDPGLTVAAVRRAWPFPEAVMERLGEGLRRAGLPLD